MNPPGEDKVRDALSQGQCARAVALLQQLGPAAAANVMMGMPFEGMGLDGYDNASKEYISIWIAGDARAGCKRYSVRY